MFSSIWAGKPRRRHGEHEPLLPQYNDVTARQTRLHEKLHTYQMLRAMSKGYMPSNEQVIIHLRTLLSADILNPNAAGLSPSGRALVRSMRLWIEQFISVLQSKNGDNQIQDFIWYLAKARLQVDVSDIQFRAAAAKARADASATASSIRTLGSLMLTNSDFRVFLADLSTIGRQVFRDAALTLSDVSQRAGKQIEPSQEERQALKQNGEDSRPQPSKQDLEEQVGEQVTEVAKVVVQGASEVAQEAAQSLTEHVTKEERDVLMSRLKGAVLKLRQVPDYSESASTLSLLLRRYLMAYSRAASDTLHAVEEDVGTNAEADRALHNFWLFVRSIGNQDEWERVENSFDAVVQAGQSDPGFEELVTHLSQLVQDMLLDPDFFDNAEERFEDVRAKSKEIASETSISNEIDALFKHLQAALRSVADDGDMHNLARTSVRIAHLISPSGQYTNKDLVSDSINVFLPVIVQAVQYLPIPRVEVATPGIDLLLENLVLQPGRTVNSSSFLPYRLQISTKNDIDVYKARFQTMSSMKSLLTVKISGMSIAAEDLGYWFHTHSGLLRMVDEGLASFYLDERGIDITLDIEIGRESLEQMVTLRNVDVKIHHLNYKLRRTKFAFFAWIFRPLIRPIVRKALEVKIATAIGDSLHTLNRELLFARERLRATRIAGPSDMWTFIRAVATRLMPKPDPDLQTRVGVKPGGGPFRGRYAPGSLVQLWEEEARDAGQKIYEYERGGWRNDIFDVVTTEPSGV